MKALLADIFYALFIGCFLLFIIMILFENIFEFYFPFAVIGQSVKPLVVMHPWEPILRSVSQSSTFNSANASANATNVTETNDEGIEGAAEVDIFGITKIYPTKGEAREWFLNMSDPKNSSNFFITDNLNLTKLSDGSWRINASHVRMIVNTSEGQQEWKNVEITGYVRLSQLSDENVSDTADTSNGVAEGDEIDDLVFISRSGRHSSEVPCEGTAYNAGVHTDGSVGWKKEIWHTGGYTEERARQKIAESYLNKWIGLKAAVYNVMTNNETGVKLEMYIDDSDNGNNNWTKVSDIIDSGGWYTKSDNTEFFSAGCGRPRDFVIIDGGPNAIFRTDNMVLDFKNLSVREIQPPPQLLANANLSSVLKLQ
jgi:hypothetical protein